MAVQPSQNITEILSGTLGGRPNSTQINRSGAHPGKGSQPNRIMPEPAGGYDPKAPRGTYIDISV
jgi:hypothetical protein